MPLYFVTYETATGTVKASLTVPDADAMEANTPQGYSSLVVEESSPVREDQRGWSVVSGTLVQITLSPAAQLLEAQAAQSVKIEAAYQNATFQTPIAYKGTTFWTDQNSQNLLMGAVIGFQMSGSTPEGFAWWDATGSPVPMTLTDMQGLYQAILMQVNVNFVKRKALLGDIATAITIDAVKAISW